MDQPSSDAEERQGGDDPIEEELEGEPEAEEPPPADDEEDPEPEASDEEDPEPEASDEEDSEPEASDEEDSERAASDEEDSEPEEAIEAIETIETIEAREAGEPEESSEPEALSPSAAAMLRSIRSAPLLAELAAAAALVEMVLGRALPPALGELLSRDALITLRRAATLPRNIAAIAGILALSLGLVTFLRTPGHAPIRRRLAAAAFSGVLMPTLVMSTLLPPERTSYHLILFAIAAANILAVLFHLTGVRYAARYEYRIVCIMALVASLSALIVVVVSQVSTLTRLASVRSGLLLIRHAGELAWLAVPMLAALGLRRKRSSQRRLAVSFGGLLLGLALAFALTSLSRERSQSLVYVTLRGLLLLESAPWLYALPFAIGITGALDGLISRSPNERQLGAGLLLWLSAGYAPHTPIQLLALSLGALLLARATQGDDESGAWQKRWPWSLLGVPRPDAS